MPQNSDACEGCESKFDTKFLRYVKTQEGEVPKIEAAAHVDGYLYLCTTCRSMRKG